MFKKIAATVLVLGGMLVTGVFANYGGESSRSTVYPGNFNFKAVNQNGNVSMTWNKFNVPSGKSFAYYKVVRSQTKDNPLYPEDGYIKYDSNLGFTSYVDEDPLVGKSYYRVCAILDGNKRYCSNVVKVTITDTSSETEEVKSEPKTTVKPVVTELSDEAKAVMDDIAASFLKKVNEKFANNPGEKNGFIVKIVAQLDILAKRNATMKSMIAYLKTKIQPVVDPMDQIKSILDVN